MPAFQDASLRPVRVNGVSLVGLSLTAESIFLQDVISKDRSLVATKLMSERFAEDVFLTTHFYLTDHCWPVHHELRFAVRVVLCRRSQDAFLEIDSQDL